MSKLTNPAVVASEEMSNQYDIGNIDAVFGSENYQGIYDAAVMASETEGVEPTPYTAPGVAVGSEPIITRSDIMSAIADADPNSPFVSQELNPNTLYPNLGKNINVGNVSGVMGSLPVFSASGFVFPEGAYKQNRKALVEAAQAAEKRRMEIFMAVMPKTADQYQQQLNDIGFNTLEKHLQAVNYDWAKLQNVNTKEGREFWRDQAKLEVMAREYIQGVGMADAIIKDSLDTNKTVPDYVRNAAIKFKSGTQDMDESFKNPASMQKFRNEMQSYYNLMSIVTSDKFRPAMQTHIAGIIDSELQASMNNPEQRERLQKAYQLRRDTGSNELYTKALLEWIPKERILDMSEQIKASYTLSESPEQIAEAMMAYIGTGKWTLDETILSKVDVSAQMRIDANRAKLKPPTGPEKAPAVESIYGTMRNVVTDETTNKPRAEFVQSVAAAQGQGLGAVKKVMDGAFSEVGKQDGTDQVRYNVNLGDEYLKASLVIKADDPEMRVYDQKGKTWLTGQQWIASRTEDGKYKSPEGLSENEEKGEDFLYKQLTENGEVMTTLTRATAELQNSEGIATYSSINDGKFDLSTAYTTFSETMMAQEIEKAESSGDKDVVTNRVNAPRIMRVYRLNEKPAVDVLESRVSKANIQGRLDEKGANTQQKPDESIFEEME